MIVSIVIFQHDYKKIKELIDKLKSCEIVEKIILVDNGGCDWASEINNPLVDYIKSPKNGGFGYGHNLAINKFAHLCNYFLICNPDIDFDSKELEKFYNTATTLSAGLFSPKIVYPDGSNQYGQRLLPHPLNLFSRRFLPKYLSEQLDNIYLLKGLLSEEPALVPYVSGSFMLFKSESLLELNGFDERYFMYMEDIDLSRRCGIEFGNLYIPNAHIFHEHQQASYKTRTMLKAHVFSGIQYFNKWGWFFDKQRRRINKKTLARLKKSNQSKPFFKS